MAIKPKFLLIGIGCLAAVFWWTFSPFSGGQIAEFLKHQAAISQTAPVPKEPGIEAIFAIAGLLAVAYLVLRQK